MSWGAEPVSASEVRTIIDRKHSDFHGPKHGLRVLYLGLDEYFAAAAQDPDIRFAVDAGIIGDLPEELRDPVMASWAERTVFTCPPLALQVLSAEPAEIHRPFVEGAFMRKMFRFFVPAAHEGGAAWEASSQVREIMARHFSLQLVATETVLGEAA